VHIDAHAWSVLLVGIVVASFSAFFAIWGLMRILQNFSTWPFVIYRILLGAVIIIGAATGWVV
jgi:undecaprenyl-diphosphatase